MYPIYYSVLQVVFSALPELAGLPEAQAPHVGKAVIVERDSPARPGQAGAAGRLT